MSNNVQRTVKIFLSKGCAPSKQYRTKLDNGVFKFGYSLYDIEEHAQEVHSLKILAVPCTIFFDEGDKEVKRLYGFSPKDVSSILNMVG